MAKGPIPSTTSGRRPISWLYCRLIGLMLLQALPAMAADKPATKPDSADTAMDPIIVQGKRNPLDKSDKKLKAIKHSLPGSDKAPRKNFDDWYAAHADPNQMSKDRQHEVLDVMGKDEQDKPPDLQLQQP